MYVHRDEQVTTRKLPTYKSWFDKGLRKRKEFGSNSSLHTVDPTVDNAISPPVPSDSTLSRLVAGESKNPSSSIHDTGDKTLLLGGDKYDC